MFQESKKDKKKKKKKERKVWGKSSGKRNEMGRKFRPKKKKN